MKTLSLLIVIPFCFMNLYLSGQDYYSFPTENAAWNTVGDNDFTLQEWRFRYAVYGDTSIGSHQYVKLYEMYDSTILHPNSTYFAAIRENDNKQVFCLIPGFPEVMLYDFNLEPGDTMFYSIGGGLCYNGVEFWEENHFRVVVSKDQVLLPNGQLRNRWVLAGNLGDQTWIEGIGSINWFGLFNPVISAMALCGDSYQFACFKENDTVLYLDNPFCNSCFCQLLTGEEEWNKIPDEDILLYPNPTSGDFVLEAYSVGLKPAGYLVLDPAGRILLDGDLHQGKNLIKAGSLVNGVYVVKIVQEGSSIGKALKFIKN